jgi:DNA-directed RNA polymerase sigma subunit (sigma70/sigma32)
MGDLVGMAFAARVDDIEATDVAEEAVVSAEVEVVRHHVAGLPEPFRSVIEWRYGLRGSSIQVQEIASILNCSASQVRRIEEHALELLRSAYELPEAA